MKNEVENIVIQIYVYKFIIIFNKLDMIYNLLRRTRCTSIILRYKTFRHFTYEIHNHNTR